jgi:hypothetical protein
MSRTAKTLWIVILVMVLLAFIYLQSTSLEP